MHPASLAFAMAFGAMALVFAAPPGLAQGSGKFERTQPAAPTPAAPAAPAPADPLIRELMRKAQAKESENGLCARVADKDGARLYQDPDLHFYKRRPAGSTIQYSRRNAFLGKVTCGLYRVASVFTMKGRRCVRIDHWNCVAGEACGAGRATECENASGNYEGVEQTKAR